MIVSISGCKSAFSFFVFLALLVCNALLPGPDHFAAAQAPPASQYTIEQYKIDQTVLSREARERIVSTIRARRLAKRERGSASAEFPAKRATDGAGRLFSSRADVEYTSTYFDTEAGDAFSFPEDTHDFCRAYFASAEANQDFALNAFVTEGSSLTITASWSQSTQGVTDLDLYLFDVEGKTVGDPTGAFPQGANGIDFQTDGSNLFEEALLDNTGPDQPFFAVVDRFRGPDSTAFTLTLSGDDGTFEVLEYVDNGSLFYYDAAADPDSLINTLEDNVVIDLNAFENPRPNFNVVFDAFEGCVESVGFTLVNQTSGSTVVDNAPDDEAPFALFGDDQGDLAPGDLTDGTYELTVTPYSEDNLQGASAPSLTVVFVIENTPSAGSRVVDFTLIDADTDAPVPGVNNPIQDGDVIDLTTLSRNLTLGAIVEDDAGVVDSVRFDATIQLSIGGNATLALTDAGPPYSAYGEAAGDFTAGPLPAGRYVLTGTPVGMPGTDPAQLTARTLSFTLLGPRISNFTLIDADANLPIAVFDPIPEDTTLDLAALPPNLNIRANTIDYDPPVIDRVVFSLFNAGGTPLVNRRPEGYRPYALFGDFRSDLGLVDVDPPDVANYSAWGSPPNGALLIVGESQDAANNVLSIDSLAFTNVNAAAAGKVGEISDIPELLPNFPNPFNPVTTIRFGLAERMRVRLAVFDMLGREVHVLIDDDLPAGFHEAPFDAGSLASGMYMYRLETPDAVQVRPMTLMK